MTEVLNASLPIVLEDGTMQVPFRDFLIRLSDNTPIVGSGSPEGAVDSPQFTLYIDSIGVTGTIEYRKMLTDIGGDTTKGWVLV